MKDNQHNQQSDKNNVVEYYNRIATEYDNDRFNNTYGKFIDAEERSLLLNLGAGTDLFGKTLEIACGTGRLTEFASVGLDGSSEMLSIAKQKYPQKEFIFSDARKINMSDESFNTIFSFHLLMHLQTSDIQEIIKECYRLLKPGGRLIFDIPSQKRRNFLRKDNSQGWHGATSMSIVQIEDLSKENFRVNSVNGILFLPIHHISKKFRYRLLGFDKFLCKSMLKEYSSYLLFELIKK